MHQLCLVSDQPMPNFLAAIEPSLGVKQVTLAVTARMADKATWLEEALHRHQIETARLPIANHTDFEGMWTTFAEWAETHQQAGEQVALNVTGGTKLMAIAAQDAFRSAGVPVFYLDLDTNRAVWVEGGIGAEAKTFQPTRQPSLETAFALNGFIIEDDAERYTADPRWRGFLDAVADHFDAWGKAIGALNGAAMDAEKNRDDWLVSPPYPPAGWNELLETLIQCRLVGVEENGNHYFLGEEERKFCNGGWFEHYVFRLLKERFGLKRAYARMNVTVKKADVFNELDCAVVSQGTLFLLECKTANLRRQEGTGFSVASNVLYKIAELTRNQGLSARGIVVSAFKVRPDDQKRAKLFGVRVLDNFKTLEQDLRQALKL